MYWGYNFPGDSVRIVLSGVLNTCFYKEDGTHTVLEE